MITPRALRISAEKEAANLPPILARAEQLAGAILLGEHGRRRAGMGDDFWQYRAAQLGDTRQMIDWRRSARSDAEYVRERELQVPQSVMLWIDSSASMRFSSSTELSEKAERARLLALASSILLIKAGERVGITSDGLPPRGGRAQIARLASHFSQNDDQDYGVPNAKALIPHARAVFISDLMGDFENLQLALTKAADRDVRGTLLQVLDPVEESFPYHGRTIFESAGKTLEFETLKANDLRARYLEKLASRKEALKHLCNVTGWQFTTHHTDKPAQSALLWLHRALEQSI